MKKVLALVLLSLVLLSFVSCSMYVSHYSALMLVTTNTSEKASMSFSSFSGTKVFNLNLKDSGSVEYSAKLESGKATVYYGYNGEKTKLFEIGPGDTVNSYIDIRQKGRVYFIVETSEKCSEGSFEFRVTYN